MGVVFQDSYELPAGDQPLTHSRIAHSRNWLKGGTFENSSLVQPNYFVAAPDNTLTYERWKPVADLPAYWNLNFTVAQTADYCFIAGHTFGSTNSRIVLQASVNNDDTWVNLSPEFTPNDNMPIFFIFAPQTALAFRVQLVSVPDENNLPYMSVCKFGTALQFQQPFFGDHRPIDLARNTVIRSNYSETGEFLGRAVQRTYNTSSFTWEHLSNNWTRTNGRDLQKAVTAEPFCIAWRPSQYDEVAFGQTDQPPIPTQMGLRDYMTMTLTMRSLAYD